MTLTTHRIKRVITNNQVCLQGAIQDIGFHIRIPFFVQMAGAYSFRMHADFGAASRALWICRGTWARVTIDRLRHQTSPAAALSMAVLTRWSNACGEAEVSASFPLCTAS